MRFDQKAPCKSCPFLRRGKHRVNLMGGRVDQVAGNMLSPNGKTFACHTDIYMRKRVKKIDRHHCAGALIFALKHDNYTQMMRIAGRLGIFEPSIYEAKRLRNAVFDTLDEMRTVHEAAFNGGDTRKR